MADDSTNSKKESISIGWIVCVFTIITILGIVFLSISIPDNKPKIPKTSTEKKPNRVLSRTFTVPGNTTVTAKGMYYVYYGRGRRDKIIVKVTNGPYKNLIWLNKNLPSIQMKRPKILIYAAPPGIGKKTKIRFMNMGGKLITVRVRIIPYRT